MEPMRRFLPLSVLIVLVSVLLFGAAMAARAATAGSQEQASARTAIDAPFTVPVRAPERDPRAGGFVYGYRTSDELGAALDAREARTSANGRAETPRRGDAGTVTVTARVLPGVVVTLDAGGQVAKLETNTADRNARDVMLVLPRELDAATWRDLRAALLDARSGTGVVWSRI